jgi:hypothetical protein
LAYALREVIPKMLELGLDELSKGGGVDPAANGWPPAKNTEGRWRNIMSFPAMWGVFDGLRED